MSKANVTKRRGSKPKTKKESPEVFVLPPNLLEKLGINLGNYGSASGSTVDSQHTGVNFIPEENSPPENNLVTRESEPDVTTSSDTGSSIIQTAELMKKSVFLSPTFISNHASIIQGEIEIVGNVDANIIDIDNRPADNEECVKKIEVSIGIDNRTSLNIPKSSAPISLYSQESKECDQLPKGNAEIHDIGIDTLIDDHADEAYSSDCSNSNYGCLVKSNMSKSNKNKINVISEQIILPSQFHKFKSNYSTHENSLVHVPIHATVKSHKQSTVMQQSVVSMDSNPNVSGSMEQVAISVVDVGDINEQRIVEGDSDVSMADFEILPNINKMDICAVLNVTESELVIASQTQDDFQQSFDALQTPHKEDVNFKDNVVLDTKIFAPCHLNIDGGRNMTNHDKEDFSSVPQKYTVHDNNTPKKAVEIKTDTFIAYENDDIFKLNERKSNKSVEKDTIIVSDVTADKIEILLSNQEPPISCMGVPASESEIHNQQQINTEQFRMLQDGQADLKKSEKKISGALNQPSNKSNLKIMSKLDKYRRQLRSSHENPEETNTDCSSDILRVNKCKPGKVNNSNSVKTSADIPIFYVKDNSRKLHNSKVFTDDQLKQNKTYENKELHEQNDKISNEGTTEKADLKAKAIHEDKVREIAEYLIKFAELKKRTHLIQRNTIVAGKSLNRNKNALNTKSSIQGVEKPGGSRINQDNDSSFSIRTYERRKKPSQKKIPLSIIKQPKTYVQSTVINDSSSNITCYERETCLCHDFGRLSSYDDPNSYAHIHFWNNARTDTKPDDIFSIYNEDTASITNDSYITSDIEICPSETPETLPKLCWNDMKFINDIEFDGDKSKHVKKKTNPNVEGIERYESIKTNIQNESRNSENKLSVPSAMKTVKLEQNCDGLPYNEISQVGQSTNTGQKRKRSVNHVDNSEPPAKNIRRISTLIPQTKPELVNEKRRKSVDYVKSSVKCSPGKVRDALANTVSIESSSNGEVSAICGVCQLSVEDANWIEHIATHHGYLAWKCGEPALDVDDEVAVREHLNEILKVSDGLKCGECGLTRKNVKAYLSHVRRCSGSKAKEGSSEITSIVDPAGPGKEATVSTSLIKCGVCGEHMQDRDWNDHRASRHDYLAWKQGETPLDVKDEAAVRDHLYEITKVCGGLRCAKCGLHRKYVRAFLSHIRSCTGLSESENDSAYNVSVEVIPKLEPDLISRAIFANVSAPILPTSTIQCGVCEEAVWLLEWYHHIGSRHDYLAWRLGDSPLDVNDQEAVRSHLYNITKAYGGLTCAKCGLIRKYVKAYLNHIKSCEGLNESQNDVTYNVSSDAHQLDQEVGNAEENSSTTRTENEIPMENGGLVNCAVCAESIQQKDWICHIASQHDYLAWKVGDTALDLEDEEAVKEHLYGITKACGGLTCSKCGRLRKYAKTYLTHFKTCDGLNKSQHETSLDISTEVRTKMEVNPASDPQPVNSATDSVLIQCGVCMETVKDEEWYDHIGFRHNYLAWKVGETALDISDEEAVRKHLYAISITHVYLKCPKCGLTRKYVKAYLNHYKNCTQTSPLYTDNNLSTEVSEADLDEFPDTSTRKDTEKEQPSESVTLELTEAESLVKCGVCGQYVENEDWIHHIFTQHEYMAWKEGATPLDVNDKNKVRKHLRRIIHASGTLNCPKCDLPRKSVRSYLQHLKFFCDQHSRTDTCTEQKDEGATSFRCGVCNEVVISLDWAKHLSEKHDYLAWKNGDNPVNVEDDEELQKHLHNFVKEFGCLCCRYCGKNRKYVKSYLDHIQKCKDGGIKPVDITPTDALGFEDAAVDFNSGGTCAICHKEVEAGKWIHHTQKEHNYLAWREGEKPWDLDSFEDLNQYLYIICKRMNGLTCNKCGLVRKYVKTYLTHIRNCDVVDFNFTSSVTEGIGPVNTGEVQCAMCKELIKPEHWKKHAMEKHYNISWIIGETPIDIKNPYAVERFLKEYKQVYRTLKCRTCGTTRTSFAGFYAHIIACGKTEEEIDIFRLTCNICNNKYLCIYKNQHAMIHKVQAQTAELKLKPVESKEDVPHTSGKRRAAMKARTVIENYNDNMSKFSHSCQTCGFGTDFKDELKTHKCQVSNGKDFSGGESSAAEIGSSDDESGDTDVDSNISNEVNENDPDEEDEVGDEGEMKKKRYRDPAPVLSKVARIPFKVEDVNSYIRQGDVDYINTYLTDELLYPLWQPQQEAVPETDLVRYLPPLETSCKFKYDSDWMTLNRFEATQDRHVINLFVGASISCVAWAPFRVEHIENGSTNFLAVACHNGSDSPRYLGSELPRHENLIQIWNFKKFRELPQLVYGIAHDFGTVWSMEWCPSGARDTSPDVLPDVSADVSADVLPDVKATTCRLGLLAVACSSGSVYIFAVPYPIANDNQIVYKLKPVAELRMTMGSERKMYQATSVSWSKQKEHKLVLVGYADGSTAYYDLHSDSPLLVTMEKGVQVFHPYNDERPHNTCITGTDLYPVSGDTAGCGASASTAPTGAELAARAGAGAGAGAGGRSRVRVPTAALGVAFAPHACAAAIAGDDAIMQASISELVWVAPGRRLGGTRRTAACTRCGRVAAFMPPTVRLMRMHPSYCDANKQVIGILEMTHLAKKRKKQVNDELCMTVEPTTYDETISKYGIQFSRISTIDRAMQQQYAAKPKTHCPERFPLADIKSMAFCPSRRFHDKLALATHSGILIVTTIK